MDRLLTNAEAAEILGVDVRTLARLRAAGAGPRYIRIGLRFIRYSERALTEWVEARTHASLAAELTTGRAA